MIKIHLIRRLLVALIVVFMVVATCGSAVAVTGDAAKGEIIYKKRCAWCHGLEGLGDGFAANFLIPGPRDFSDATFKYRSSAFDELVPLDDDIFNIIKGTAIGDRSSAMPGFSDVLSDADIWDVVAHIKTLSGMEGVETPQKIDLSGRIRSSEESIREGKRLFEEKGRCTDCHGLFGRGDAIKALKDDWGQRTWPRNFTKGWSFMVSNDPVDIYTRISTGIPGTQMPSFADPVSKLALTDAERWHVANYVASLDALYKRPVESALIKARRVDGELPKGVDDREWDTAEFVSFRTLPQLMIDERLYTPTIDSVSIKALYNKADAVFLIEWDDRTESIPGDERAEKLAIKKVYPDALAIEFPVGTADAPANAGAFAKSIARAHFAEGSSQSPVDIWLWKGKEALQTATIASYIAKGFKERQLKDSSKNNLSATARYANGTWRVMFKRQLTTARPTEDAQFSEGGVVPIAIAVWDGSNDENGSRHSLTTWHNVSFSVGDETSRNRWLWPVTIAVFVFVAELLYIRGVKND